MPESVEPRRPAAEHEVRSRLAADERTAGLAEADLSPVAGGLSNFAWRAVDGGNDWFIRLARPATAHLGADHVNECRVLQCVANAGLAPAVLRCDPQARVLVTRWTGSPCWAASAAQGAYLLQLAAAIARLHALPPWAGLRTVDFAAQARSLEWPGVAAAMQLRSTASAVFARLDRDHGPRLLCHNDLNPLNIVGDSAGKLWLVDWEYAGLGDPVFDLASCASQHALTDGQAARFVESYRAQGGSCDDTRFVLARWGFDYVQWLWYLGFRVQGDAAGHLQSTQRAAALLQSLQERARSLPHCNN